MFSDFAAVKAIIKSWPVFILEIEDPNEDDSNSSKDDEESNVEILESEGKFDFLDSALF